MKIEVTREEMHLIFEGLDCLEVEYLDKSDKKDFYAKALAIHHLREKLTKAVADFALLGIKL